MTSTRTHHPPDAPQTSLRSHALQLLLLCNTQAKAHSVRALPADDLAVDTAQRLPEPAGVPGRPERPTLVLPGGLQQRSVGTPQGHASLIHALAHIEANAINLALDAVWRFTDMPEAFYRDWWQVAVEEALHFQLLEGHLHTLGHAYGDFPAHDGLWDMASKTQADLLARLALVPRTLEARGLDATPAIRTKLISVGDKSGAAILDIILRDEIGHVATGNRWYAAVCRQRGLDPIATYAELALKHAAPVLKGPFNLAARRAAGFTDTELAVFQRIMAVNYFGALHCTKAALPSLIARSGQIIVLSSLSGFVPLHLRSAYNASKHALHGLFDTLRQEVREAGVNVLLVCPGFTATDMHSHELTGVGVVPPLRIVGRVTSAQDVAEAIFQAALRRRTQLVISNVGWRGQLLARGFPRLFQRLVLARRPSG